jgi:hypothetical protein
MNSNSEKLEKKNNISSDLTRRAKEKEMTKN